MTPIRWRYMPDSKIRHAHVGLFTQWTPTDRPAACGKRGRWFPNRPRNGGPLASAMWRRLGRLKPCRLCASVVATWPHETIGEGS